MKRIITIATTSVILTACGGGGGGGSDSVSGNGAPPQQMPAQQLGTYIGTWVSDCDEREIETTSITRTANDTIKVVSKSDVYSGDKCTGAVVATLSMSADASITYTGTADASVALPPATSTSSIKVDRITVSIPSHTLVVTGDGIKPETRDGKSYWCKDLGGGSSTCFLNDGVRPAESFTGALYAQDNHMYTLEPSGSTFIVSDRYTRK